MGYEEKSIGGWGASGRNGGQVIPGLPLPPHPVRPIPFHRLRRPAIELAVAWKPALDAWETPR